MINRQVFRNAPITEALLDFKVELPSNINLDKLLLFQKKIEAEFPKRKNRVAWKSEIKFQENEAPQIVTPSGGLDGYLFESSNQEKAVQVRLDGFTFNKLRPYDKWETFLEEAKKLWHLYVELTNPLVITRIGLRYINRIEIPLPFNDFREYILTIPVIAPQVPQGLSDFFMRLVIPKPDTDLIAFVTETIAPETMDKKVPVIFDIDVFSERQFELMDDNIWETINQLHEYKNQIFFNSVTEKAEELFK